MKHEKKIIILICIVLGLLPFLWFKPGEVNFGGDSSRLYFYDPANYLRNVALYNIAPGETGYENIAYFYIPFTILLLALKTVFFSPYLLNTSYTSFMVVAAFVFVYLSVIELLKAVKKEVGIWELAAGILGSFVYLFAPMVNHWDKALITHNQIFLNPLIFYLGLRFIHTRKMVYVIVALLVTFLFAPNFSFTSAPNFFAFYPLAIVFLFIYARWIRKASISWKKTGLIFILFVGIHSFHLIPQVMVILDKESSEFQRVFAAPESTSFQVDAGVKVSRNMMSMKQGEGIADVYMVVVPLVVLVGLFFLGREKKSDILFRRTMLLLTVFFLITLYLDTANITPLFANIFELLFKIPGFSMFRNYYGQFLYVFYFFYSLLFAFSLAVVLTATPKSWKHAVGVFFTVLLVVNGWRFLNGEMVHLSIFGTKDISVPFKIDPDFEETLNFIRNDSTDGKYLTLPLTLYGYQLLGGTEGGLYIGPSMIGYLTDKKDFTGYQGLAPFGDLFFSLVSEGDYKGIQMVLSWLNIRYYFHNEDPYIYDSFTQFPYSVGYNANQPPVLYGIKRFFPNQSSIKDLVTKLEGKLVYTQGKYSIYENEFYLPHIYIPKKNILAQGFQNSWIFPLEASVNDPRIVFYETVPSHISVEDIFIKVARDGLIASPSEIPYKVVSPSAGEYKIYVKHEFLKDIDNKSMYIKMGDQKLHVVNNATDSAWLRFENLKIGDNNKDVPLLFTIENGKSPPVKPNWNVNNMENGTAAQTSIEGWTPRRQYLISFEYNSKAPVLFRLFENTKAHDEEKLSVQIEQPLTSNGWSQYQNVVAASQYATDGIVELIGASQQAIESSIKNFSIIEIHQPEIVLRKVNTSTFTENIPQITFTRINPSKYIVDIKNAKDPYTLVFLAAFNKKWKLFLSDSGYLTNPDNIVKTYFNGDIKEGRHSTNFINRRVFETFGKMPVADQNHFVANGYANGWFISPSDVSNQTDYVLVLEMTGQRNFYIALIISGIFIGICVGYMASVLLRSYTKRK